MVLKTRRGSAAKEGGEVVKNRSSHTVLFFSRIGYGLVQAKRTNVLIKSGAGLGTRYTKPGLQAEKTDFTTNTKRI